MNLYSIARPLILFAHTMKSTKFKTIDTLEEFDKELKKLRKKFQTLEEDLVTLIDKQLYLFHKLDVDNRGTFPISNLGKMRCEVYKTKKFACRSLKGKGSRTGLRLIHVYWQKEDKIELVEIYYKGDKENEDRERIKSYYCS